MKKQSTEIKSPGLCKIIISRGKSCGKTHEMAIEIKKTLEERGECGVGLMSDASEMIRQLKALGVNARAEPCYRVMPPMIKLDKFGNPVDLSINEKVQTGMVFYLC